MTMDAIEDYLTKELYIERNVASSNPETRFLAQIWLGDLPLVESCTADPCKCREKVRKLVLLRHRK